MQGIRPISQPLVDSDRNVLLWNGDVLSGSMHMEKICDSDVVMSALKLAEVPSVLREVKGPFSFIYYQKSSKLLYFGRDRFGRHSLVFRLNEDHTQLLLSSVAPKSVSNVYELPAIGIFVADFNNDQIQLKCIPWYEPNERFENTLKAFSEHFKININVVETEYLPKMEGLSLNIIPNSEMGFLKYTNLCEEYKTFDDIMSHMLKKENISQTVNNLERVLNEAVRRRVKIIPKYCKDCTKIRFEQNATCQHSKVGLLFSGGLDSAVLAVLTHNHLDSNETIDLINVAFERKNITNYEVPDRITGRQTYNELLQICPGRKFNFVDVNITEQELEKYRSTRIANLVNPHSTILDDSLACAVWFSSRGKGVLYPSKQAYNSTCRVLLLGMGADEQFGGYMRHRTTLKNKGWSALTDELKLEFARISERNLGRDDRMVADHGRQSRLPYLDEDLVTFVQRLPPWERCCPSENFPPGLGDKLLLRLLARKIGLNEASKLPKRAFQFGSRIADGKENAKDISKRI
ncbi:unnamed protein product [Trichogramma brassicae]|uniref:Glutamine amidotransferase type-2 domain-containing protein n=2 Tax=Trichogramma TaxID=7490 RepID=A0A6H5J2M9_9HYME|nr:unnamed protein product [Trichogramma brassicae]